MTGLLDINWISPVKVRELRLVGERGTLSLNYVSQELHHYQVESPSEQVEQAASASKEAGSEMMKREPLREELEAFVRAVASKERPIVGCSDAIIALDLAEKLVQSSRSGQPLEVKHPFVGGV